MILADAILATMQEPCVLQERRNPPTEKPSWAVGRDRPHRQRNIINSLWIDPSVMEEVNLRIEQRYQQAAKNELRWSEHGSDEPDILVCAYGISARICQTAVQRATEAGVPTRLIRPISLFPFPTQVIHNWAKRVKKILVVELSLGQFVEDVRLSVEGVCPVEFFGRTGGEVMTPEDVTERITALV